MDLEDELCSRMANVNIGSSVLCLFKRMCLDEKTPSQVYVTSPDLPNGCPSQGAVGACSSAGQSLLAQPQLGCAAAPSPNYITSPDQSQGSSSLAAVGACSSSDGPSVKLQTLCKSHLPSSNPSIEPVLRWNEAIVGKGASVDGQSLRDQGALMMVHDESCAVPAGEGNGEISSQDVLLDLSDVFDAFSA